MSSAAVPAQLGYRMPPEWHPHDATWLVWPKDPVTWPDRLPQVQEIFLKMISFLARHETVHLLVDDLETQEQIERRRDGLQAPRASIVFHRIKTVDAWIRDYGPNFLLRQHGETMELAFNHWGFNAWGNKYEEFKKDAHIPEQLEHILKLPRFRPPLVLEGGSIDVNGEGICLTTEQCLLNNNRNPEFSKTEIEDLLKDYLGVQQIIWLGGGIAGDDTDGHIDDVARFVNSRTIVGAIEEHRADENFEILQDNFRRLQLARDCSGRPFELVSLPMPGCVETADGRLPASYANFYIANEVVLVPTFAHPNDQRALDTLQKLFPDRQVTGIHCEPLVWGMGTIHCVTQQQPATSVRD